MSHDTSPRTDAAALSALVERLRDIAEAPDGAALARQAGPVTHAAHEAADTIDRLTRERDTLRRALEAVLREPHGCPMCDSGKLRNPDKAHWPECPYLAANQLRTSEPREPEAARTEPTCKCGIARSIHAENGCSLYEPDQPAAPEPKEPQHVCGLAGYNGMIDPPCPACQIAHRAEPKEPQP
jgi:hypothetical protein